MDFSVQDKLLLTKRLDELGFDYVEGGYPASNEKDAEFFRRVRDLDLKNVRVCAFGMTRRKGVKAADDTGLKALLDSGAQTITLVGKASAFQAEEVLRTSLDENLAMIRESIALLVEAGREVLFDAEHYFDGHKADSEYALQTVRTAAEAGARVVILCDTNGGSMPGRGHVHHAKGSQRTLRGGRNPHAHTIAIWPLQTRSRPLTPARSTSRVP